MNRMLNCTSAICRRFNYGANDNQHVAVYNLKWYTRSTSFSQNQIFFSISSSEILILGMVNRFSCRCIIACICMRVWERLKGRCSQPSRGWNQVSQIPWCWYHISDWLLRSSNIIWNDRNQRCWGLLVWRVVNLFLDLYISNNLLRGTRRKHING